MPMCRLAFMKSDSIFVSSRCLASFDQRTLRIPKYDHPPLSPFLCFGCSDSGHLKCHVKCQFKPSPATVSCDQPAFHDLCTLSGYVIVSLVISIFMQRVGSQC